MHGFRRALFPFRALARLLLTATIASSPAAGQDLATLLPLPSAPLESLHHHEDGLHFSHPLVAESPSPDTKIRMDLTRSQLPGRAGTRHTILFEGEYAFTRSVSVEVDVPFTRLDPSNALNSNHLDTVGAALKYANFALEKEGLLLGGGIELGLPTGDEARGIGSDEVIEVEPFLDFGLQRGPWEVVGFSRFGFPTHEDVNQADLEWSWNLSLLYHLTPAVSPLAELDGTSISGGTEGGLQTINASLGLKVAPTGDPDFQVGLAVRKSLRTEREFNTEILLAVFFHF
ncbi:MAG: hypothetical protein ACE5H3_08650 [Planctomycetota bacterium]